MLTHLKLLFNDFADGRIGVLKLSWVAAPISWLRLFVDGVFPALLGIAAVFCATVRYRQGH
jgi:hypothetical protein